jgi:hypothetical protein
LTRVFVEGLGLLGPGLSGWHSARPVLAGDQPYVPAPPLITGSDLLPPAERRRAGVPVKLALAVAQEAFVNAGRDPASTATLFTSSSGDGDNVHQIFETLASSQREVSPTRFHNSVHNAAAGYWSIATQSREPSTSLCGYDASFAVGLLDAATQVQVERKAAALIAYDQPYPEPLLAKRPLAGCFAVAMVLAPEATHRAHAMLDVSFITSTERATALEHPELDALRAGIPAARSLPLVQALARNRAGAIILEYGPRTRLRLTVTPCR